MFIRSCLTTLLVLLVQSVSFSQLPQMDQETKEKMEWLNRMLGTWEISCEVIAAPGQPPIACTGSMKSRKLGEHWVISDVNNEMGGTEFNAIQTLGYDSTKKKYFGTWVDSMMGHMWRYEGTVDGSGKKLALIAEGPNMLKPGDTAMYQDAYEFMDAETIKFTSSMKDENGKWVTFVTGTYTKKK